ncbi:hypothetical protein V3C99_008991 [Haemonchus contortus]
MVVAPGLTQSYTEFKLCYPNHTPTPSFSAHENVLNRIDIIQFVLSRDFAAGATRLSELVKKKASFNVVLARRAFPWTGGLYYT